MLDNYSSSKHLPATFYSEVAENVMVVVLCLRVEANDTTRDIGLAAINLALLELRRNLRSLNKATPLFHLLSDLEDLLNCPSRTWAQDLTVAVEKIRNYDNDSTTDQVAALLLASL